MRWVTTNDHLTPRADTGSNAAEPGSDPNNVPLIYALASLVDYSAMAIEHGQDPTPIDREAKRLFREDLFSEHRDQINDLAADQRLPEDEAERLYRALDALL